MSGPLYYDRVKETSSTTGTGTVTLAGAVSGFRAWSTVGDGNTAYYLIIGGTEFEVGLGTYTASGTTLARSVIASSNSNALVNFSAGSKDVVLTLAAAAITGLESIAFVSITAATSLTSSARGKTHVCSGTSANYTVDLPTSGMSSGDTISFRMAEGLTKLVTLDAGGGVTINGTQTRIMWAGETATLEWDGSNWFKRSGKTIPFTASLQQRSADTSVIATPNVWTPIPMDTVASGAAVMLDGVNSRLKIPRPGAYILQGFAYVSGLSTGLYVGFAKNADDYVTSSIGFQQSIPITGTAAGLASKRISLTTGDYINLLVNGLTAAGTCLGTNSAVYPELSATEVTSW